MQLLSVLSWRNVMDEGREAGGPDGGRFVDYHVGTSGFVYRHWSGVFYPPGLPQGQWLAYYARRFATVELNSTFYHLPSEAAFDGWRARTPEGFVFAVKASRFITHIKRLRDAEVPVRTFLERARRLGQRLGPVLYQLPLQMRRDDGLLEAFLVLLPKGYRHAFEFRNEIWFADGVLDLLRWYNAGFCVMDMVGYRCPLTATADFAYVRFHGPSGAYFGPYSDAELREWAGKIRGLASGLDAAYVYFNNDAGGAAVSNALTLGEMLRE